MIISVALGSAFIAVVVVITGHQPGSWRLEEKAGTHFGWKILGKEGNIKPASLLQSQITRSANNLELISTYAVSIYHTNVLFMLSSAGRVEVRKSEQRQRQQQ